jgi:hypothetical protein
MSVIDKEKIYVELRNYHLEQFSDSVNPRINKLRVEFGTIEDNIIGMILSLVNGKAEFVDAASELNAFQDKLRVVVPDEDINKNLFMSKIQQLMDLLVLVKESNFKLRTVRVAKAAVR